MDLKHHGFVIPAERTADTPDVTIVMPCLDEIQSLPHCIGNALEALVRIRLELGLSGEIVIADNGSTDGSQSLATELGARVAPVAQRGYGAALIGGCRAAQGRYILMGDADGSYDFTEGVAMIAKLLEGHDLCMGSRFRGGIAPGAMPWKNRYIGNPALTGILNLFFRSGVSDAHCGLRAITKDAFERINLTGSGMEFASEMVIKSALLRLDIAEVPATLSPDLRDREPHLRPWRDGWRHLRYLFMLSPTWLFGVPALLAFLTSAILLTGSAFQTFMPGSAPFIGDYWTILGESAFTVGHLCLILMLAGQLYSLKAGFRKESRTMRWLAPFLNLESMLIAGGVCIAVGAAILGLVWTEWVARNFRPTQSVFLPVVGTMAITAGIRTALGGFLMAIISGNEARFVDPAEISRQRQPAAEA
ncbi:MAG: glycosyltransferase family 2 protein [Sphingomonadales bacterium]|nr:glycosyltransferase family 2 protein [Sphingomonadales bacterium]MDE2569956.1 glycosyltransferase family 2 protein [Sphingomonadales bacterium]